MSDIKDAIDMAKVINTILQHESTFLKTLSIIKPCRSEEETWTLEYEIGIQRCVQAIHDLAIDNGAYCYTDEW